MLPAASRMRRSSDFASVVQGGVRSRGGALVVHQRDLGQSVPIVGLVVGRAVGNSVARHRVSRRLRAQLGLRLNQLPPGSGTVVRALPSAARATSAELGRGLDTAFARLSAGVS